MYESTVKVPVAALVAGFIPESPSMSIGPRITSVEADEKVITFPTMVHVTVEVSIPSPFVGFHTVIVKSVSGYVITISQGLTKLCCRVKPIL